MSRLLAAMMLCGSLAVGVPPASAQVAAPSSSGDAAIQASVSRTYQDASRIVGLVSAVTDDPRIREARTFEELSAVLDRKAGEITSARAEIAAINNRLVTSMAAISSETEAGRKARILLDDLGSFIATSSSLLQRVDDMRTAFHDTDVQRGQRVHENIGALRAGPIVSLEWGEALLGARAADAPMPSLGYALNGGLGCYYRGLALMHRAAARLSTPAVAGNGVSGAADCVRRMIDMAGEAQPDAAARQTALNILQPAAVLLERAAEDVRAAPAGTDLLPGYAQELRSIQTRINGLETADGVRRGG